MARAKGDFSKGSVVKTILRLALPVMLAEVVHITYNIVDRLYIGRMPGVGTAALTGIGVAFPLISLIGAFANLFGTGGAPLASIARGEGDDEKAGRIQETAFSTMLIIGAIVTVLMYIFSPALLKLMGGDADTLPYALDYFRIYVLGSVPVLISLGMNPFINGQGFSRIGMMTVLIGAVVNIVLDPILIYTAGMGIKGAAVATVISQTLSAIWVVVFLAGKWPIVPIKKLRIDMTEFKNIAKLGLTGFTFKATNSVVQAIVNIMLKTWGGALSTLYIGSMTIINSIKEIAMCPANGIVSGAMPVMSYNYGAKRPDRVSKAMTVILVGVVISNLILWAFMVFTPQLMYSIFTNDADLIEVGAKCARVYFLVFPMMSLQMVGQYTFVSLNYPKYALFFSLFRKIILVAPLTLIFPNIGLGVMGVFFAETVAQAVGASATFITMYKKVWSQLKREAALLPPDIDK